MKQVRLFTDESIIALEEAIVTAQVRTTPPRVATLTYPRPVVVAMRGPFLGKSCLGRCVPVASPHPMLEHGVMRYIGGGVVY